MELHIALKELVDRVGPGVLDDPATLRGVLDDVLDEETATLGDLNLLVDALRLGAVEQLLRILDTDADPIAAATSAGTRLARDRGGGDPQASSWACAVLGFALGRVPEDVVRRLRDAASTAVIAPAPPPRPATVQPPTTAAPPTMAAPPSAPAPERGIRSPARPGRRALSVALVVALAVAAGVVAAFVLTSDGDPEAGADDATATPTDVGGPVECWDGTKVSALAACSAPQGEAGLFWVFPDSDADGCGDIATGRRDRVVDRYCSVELASGGEAQFHYSEWTDFDRMRSHYRGVQVGPELVTERDDLHALSVADADASNKAAVFYGLRDAPWAVAVYAVSSSDLDLALGLLQIRPADQLRGLDRQQQHVPTSFSVMPGPDA